MRTQSSFTNQSIRRARGAVGVAALLLLPLSGFAGDWPMWGGTAVRNMVSTEKDLPTAADTGKVNDDTGQVDVSTTRNVKWVAKLGSQSYGNATVGGGHVYVGTNNGSPRDPRYKGDFGILLCFDEATGKFLWQLAVPKLAAGNASDWSEVGLCCSPTIDHQPGGDRVYLVTNRCEVLCLDAAGMANGNQGPFTDEAQYTAGPGKPAIPSGPTDADILWRYDMREELGVFPHEMTSSSVLVVGDRLYVTTSNGVDWSTVRHRPSPNAPALICLDKTTGKLLGRENSGISSRTFYCNWSSPSYGTVAGKPTVVFGGGDGICYGFDPEPEGGLLRERWHFDCNPPERRVKNGKPLKYGDSEGPSEILGTPVIDGGKVYIATGQDPEHGDGAGCVSCIDASDSAGAKAVWQNNTVGRTMSTAAVADGLVYLPDSSGKVYCLDAATGQTVWAHDCEAHIWGSTLLAGGKLYIGDENNELVILAAGRQEKEIAKIDFGQPVYSTAVAANGVLYVATGQNLYALKR